MEISLRNMYFTTRFYDGVNGGESVTLPAGMYDAVRIVIGEGRDATGGAWYFRRFAFPPLRSPGMVPPWTMCWIRSSRKSSPNRVNTRYGSKIVEIFEDLCHQISGWLGQPESTPA